MTSAGIRRPPFVRLLAIALAMLVTLAAAALPAAAQDDDPRYAVRLVSQSSFVAEGQPFTMTLDVDGAEPTDQIKVDVWGQATQLATREQLREAIETGNPDDAGLVRLRRPYSFTYGEVAGATSGAATLTIPEDATIDQAGVYLLTVRIDRGRLMSDTLLTTTLVRSGQVGEGGRLEVAFVLPFAAGLAHQPDGSVAFDDGDLDRLAGVTSLFSGSLASLPLTLEPRPETLDALVAAAQGGDADAAALLNALQSTAGGRQVLSSSYVPVDDEALRRRDLYVLAGQLNSAGERAIEALALAGSDTDITRISRTDATDTVDTLTMRHEFGAQYLLVPDRALEPLEEERFPATLLQSFTVENSAGIQMKALVTDDHLTDLASQLDDADRIAEQPLLTQRFIADLVAAYSDEPESVRGAVVVLPDDWDVRSEAVASMLSALGTLPELHLTTVDGVIETVSGAAPLGGGRPATDNSGLLVRRLRPEAATDLGSYPARATTVDRELRGFESIAADSDVTAGLERLRLVSAADSLDVDGRIAYLDGVANGVDALLRAPDGGPALDGPGRQRVTMTSRRATIPIQVTNRLAFPMHVRIELESEKLDFPEGWLRETTLAPGPNTIEVEVEAKTSGDSLLEVTILPPDGGTGIGPLAVGSFTVRSTALSGVGLAISIVALAVLIVWWARHVLRTRKARAAQQSGQAEPRAAQQAQQSGQVPTETRDDTVGDDVAATEAGTDQAAPEPAAPVEVAETPPTPSLTRTET